MARIGRQIDHFSEIDVSGIRADFSPDRLFRYTLQMAYRKDLLNESRSKRVTVILKNPSSADEKRSDATIRKVETFVWQRFPDAAFLNIYNLFAFRATDAAEVNQRYLELGSIAIIGSENDVFLRQLLQRSDYLICAWGGPSGIRSLAYQERIEGVKMIIREQFNGPIYQVCGKQETREPLHGLMWGYDYDLKPFQP
ncbi:MAG: DUF1643 domain-containing protein [Bacteroidales bacterium]|jgi:hypothetical protein|nr:DUF1643 domain-containing protein [Bacteroidales bacterium]MDD2571153.1 DUF1643 domain-containing protein [Bacteroidales bacterium]MDD2813011.1 DUF1643 domain-containing protein [Bacteroidales bacterium]MDD3812115.1 DUF1643 domain-containing protein [Bacteroidales bacterium]MDD3871698.1 DUF1643 domain-containing protein [Bacteroidales bacterium]